MPPPRQARPRPPGGIRQPSPRTRTDSGEDLVGGYGSYAAGAKLLVPALCFLGPGSRNLVLLIQTGNQYLSQTSPLMTRELQGFGFHLMYAHGRHLHFGLPERYRYSLPCHRADGGLTGVRACPAQTVEGSPARCPSARLSTRKREDAEAAVALRVSASLREMPFAGPTAPRCLGCPGRGWRPRGRPRRPSGRAARPRW